MMSSTAELRGHVTSGIFPDEHTPIMARTWLHEGDDVTHDHTFMEIAVVLSGTALHRTIYGDQEVAAGDAFVLIPGAWHAYVQCRRLLLYNLCLGTEILQRELAWMQADPLMNYLLWTGPREQDRRGIFRLDIPQPSLPHARELLDAVGQSSLTRSESSRAEQIGRLLLFLSHLGRHIQLPHAHVNDSRPPHPAVAEGVRLLESELAEPWTLTKLAEQVDTDASYLVRLFKRDTGLSPIAYLNRARAERAALMLLRTEGPVSGIAAAVGWEDPNYFARRFRAHFGMTATEYRRRTPGGRLQQIP